MQQLNRREDGFTLIELLLAITILAIIMVPIAGSMIVILRNTQATNDRMLLSHDIQFANAYFAQDVASVGVRDYTANGVPLTPSIQLNAAYDTSPTCGTGATPTAAVRFLSDHWDPGTSPATLRIDVVAYVVEAVNGDRQLHRIRCTGSATVVSDTLLSNNLTSAAPTVTCSTACTGTATIPVPDTVTLSFVVSKPAVGDYTVTLTGQRRQT